MTRDTLDAENAVVVLSQFNSAYRTYLGVLTFC